MDILACPDCDLLQKVPELAPRSKVRCLRCRFAVATRMSEPIDMLLALTVTAAIALIFSEYDYADGTVRGGTPGQYDHPRRRVSDVDAG